MNIPRRPLNDGELPDDILNAYDAAGDSEPAPAGNSPSPVRATRGATAMSNLSTAGPTDGSDDLADHAMPDPELQSLRRLIGLKALAAVLAVSHPTVERMHAGGQLPAPIRLGRRLVRWDHQEVLDWLHQRKADGSLPTRAEWEARRRAATRKN